MERGGREKWERIYYSFVPNSLGSRWVGLVVVMTFWTCVDSLLVNGVENIVTDATRRFEGILVGFGFCISGLGREDEGG